LAVPFFFRFIFFCIKVLLWRFILCKVCSSSELTRHQDKATEIVLLKM